MSVISVPVQHARTPVLYKSAVVAFAHNALRRWEQEPQRYPWLHINFYANLGYMSPCLKTKQKKTYKNLNTFMVLLATPLSFL